MKNRFLLLSIICTLLFSSCGISSSFVGNGSTTLTTIELSKKNFKVLEKVSGKSSNTYILGIGGLLNKSLIEKAKSQMFNSANLTGGSKAIGNITYDTHTVLVMPFLMKTTVTASGYVIEFTE